MDSTAGHIDWIPAIAWCCAPDGSSAGWNRGWREYTGLPAESSCTIAWQAVVHPEDRGPFLERWRSDLETNRAGEAEIRLRRADGSYRWFLLRYEPLPDSARAAQWCGVALDIDTRKAEEQRLRNDEQHYRTITDAISQYIAVLAPDGSVQYVNQVALKRTGIQLADVQRPDSFWFPFHPEDVARVRRERSLGLEHGDPFELEVRVRIAGGQYRWHLIQYNPQHGEEGQIVRWYATGTDIDSRKKMEEKLEIENLALREEVARSSPFEDFVGSSKPMHAVLQQVTKVAPSDATVLILGETGTGKEMVARALHRRSNRAGRVFVRVNCAAIPESLLASELFGHEKGAFTGALQRRIGRFEAAHGGTLFLDEVGDLPMDTQIALLRVLQEREFERVGSNHPITVDVRVIAATNRDLDAAVAAETFRQDLFYRLNVVPISIPPLRERADDIPALVEAFVARYALKAGKKIRRIARQTLSQLQGYSWPGNIRELQNVVERAVILTDTDTFTVEESWLGHKATPTGLTAGLSALAGRELEMIEAALAECNGRVSGPSGAAAKLGIPRQTLESKIKRWSINRYGRKA